jgi:hypothetical protein
MTIETHFLISELNRLDDTAKCIFGNDSSEATVTEAILSTHHGKQSTKCINRKLFSDAFDPLAWEQNTSVTTSNTMFTVSSFDGPFDTLTTDLAPYVRSIVAYDRHLEEERLKLSGLLSAGGSKRIRTTRAARSALEGGKRDETRRERWFNMTLELNYTLVMETAGCWGGMGARNRFEENEDTASIRSTGSRLI